MKRLYPGFALIVLFASCSKKEIAAPQTSPAVAAISQIAATARPVVTTWERPMEWSRTTAPDGSTRYSSERTVPALSPELAENGLVLTFVTGYNLETPALEKPMGLPFQFYSLSGRSDRPLLWEQGIRPGALSLSVTVPAADAGQFESGSSRIQVRHILLSPTAIAATGRTAEELRNLSFRDLAALLGIAR
ncbi:hypothetical protein EPD60_01675 [Flaviaesturariibacter flavus]|uniref:Uncharacterized protein n=1 Tax=Flaviaesturariibacter flavus TaxID=2502780 RepID=A0A4R1BNG2_9BACT|nr:hypothetical protein [Flaviaesturariibacter flavus]TCJ19150.1 hypothetical protein EPD60_01675 [Flaviaesturariibacter flavus]